MPDRDLRALIEKWRHANQWGDRRRADELEAALNAASVVPVRELPKVADIERWGKLFDYAERYHGSSAAELLAFLRAEMNALPAAGDLVSPEREKKR